MMWLIGLAIAYFIVRKCFKNRNLSMEKFDPLFLYCFIGVLIGARLGHCLFYEPHYYLSSPQHVIEMLLPIEFTQNGITLTGYRGLASHGGIAGVMISVLIYCHKQKLTFLEVMDMIAIAGPFTGGCIRLGNLMNSEIIGKPTNTDYGFIFARLGEDFPRHPSQLYEAIAYFLLFLLGILIYRKHKDLVGSGFYLGHCLAIVFIFRFFVEFSKEIQSPWEAGLPLNQGQMLSIPFIIFGGWMMIRGIRKTSYHS